MNWRFFATGVALILIAGPVTETRAQISPSRVKSSDLSAAPYRSTGLLFTEIGAYAYRGSAAVVRDPRLLYTCAHVLYDEGRWADSVEFARGWHAYTGPAASQMVLLRGYRHYSTYAGSESAADFSLDFAVGYRTASTNFGPALPYLIDAATHLRRRGARKLILGYPARLDYTGAAGRYYQHSTGPFDAALATGYDNYVVLDGVSTGPGNSGGPVFAHVDGRYAVAGVLVSGTRNSIGVHGLDAASSAMSRNTLAALGITAPAEVLTVKNTRGLALTDGTTTYSRRTLEVTGLSELVKGLRFSINISTSRRGDLDVYLRSPSGRIRWVHNRSLARNAGDLVLSNVDYSSSFAGGQANGTWSVFMRDYYSAWAATYRSAAVSVSAR